MDGTRVTHRQILTVISLLTFHYGTMDIGDHGVGAHNIVPGFGNDYMCVYREFGLRIELAVAAQKRWDLR